VAETRSDVEAAPASALHGGTLGQRAAGAATWRYASLVLQGALQFAVGVLLARLLPPEDFGVVALAYIVIGFAGMFAELGLGPAVVQRHPLTTSHVRVSFTTASIAGLAIAGLFVALAPMLGLLARQDQLTDVLRATALLFVFAGLGTTARALLQRSLSFKILFLADSGSFAVGYAGVSITLALLGYGVWSLVLGALAQSLLGCVLLLAAVRHPCRPLLARAPLRELLGSGLGFTLNAAVNYLARTGDAFIVGRWLGAHSLGLYSRAYKLMQLPLADIGGVVYGVLFPAFAEIQRDPARVQRAYLLSVQFSTMISIPVMVGMIVAAPHLIIGLYGLRWAGATLPLQILCAAGLFRTISYLSCSVAQATGHVYAEMRRQIAFAFLVIGGSLLGIRYGIAGVAVGIVIATAAMYLLMVHLAISLVRCSWRDFFQAHFAGLALGGVAAATALAVRFTMEQQGAGSLWIAAAITVSCAAVLPIGVYWLPQSLRPVDLFTRLGVSASHLPLPLRPLVFRVLRTPATGMTR
jgi:teichuronic acid exporter